MARFRIVGKSASPGIAVGPFRHFQPDKIIIPTYSIGVDEIEQEVRRFHEALDKAKLDVKKIRQKVSEKLSEIESEIFTAHLFVLDDPMLKQQTEELILCQQFNAAFALEKVIKKLFQEMNKIDDEYMRERAVDIVDVGKKILHHLLEKGSRQTSLQLEYPSIIVAHDLTPSETASIEKSKILGIITERGGITSHVAILARALQVPAIVGAEDALKSIKKNELIAMDGNSGEALFDPDSHEIADYQQRKKDLLDLETKLLRLQQLPNLTKSGSRIILKANVEIEDEIDILEKYQHDGIGLCRTEFLYLNRDVYPNEDEQVETYSHIVSSQRGKKVTFRTLDIGGDKVDPKIMTNWQPEPNPFLGCRGLRLSFKLPHLFVTQLRALLRAAVHGPANIMFPMVSGLSDFILAKNYVAQAKEELRNENIAFNQEVELGVMVEVPSAALMIEIIAKKVDFISIGTNDLIQYVMASDRMNSEVVNLYNPNSPAMVRILNHVIATASEVDCPVSICGELASDEKYLPLLVGMGLREVSVSPLFIPQVKKTIRELDDRQCKNLLSQVLTLETAEEIEHFLRKKHYDRTHSQ